MGGVSKSQVSRLCEEIDGKVKAFLDRPIEGDWPYLWVDATYLKVRRGGRIVSVAVIIAVGVNADGRREVLGMEVGSSEAEPIWTEFLRKLTRRGLRGVKLVVSDAHEGIKAAVSKVLCATWQRCRVHFARNVLAHAGKSGRRVKKQQMSVEGAILQLSHRNAPCEFKCLIGGNQIAMLVDNLKAHVPRKRECRRRILFAPKVLLNHPGQKLVTILPSPC